MLPVLENNEVRILGCLIEKSIVTPDLYPLTLNALTNACNQKSARNPVMAIKPGEVQHTIRALESKHLVRTEENFKSRAEKYSQRFCNSRYSDLQFEPPELAIVCLLMLRGPQTPGELRSRSGRLHEFADNNEVVDSLKKLIDREAGSLVVELPRIPGRKDSEYMHLFAGEIDIEAYASEVKSAKASSTPARASVADLAERVAELEAEVAALKARLP